MQLGLNFRTMKGQEDYFQAYDKSLQQFLVSFKEGYVETQYGSTHYLELGDKEKAPLVLLHAASCGSTIWYANVTELEKSFHIYAIDLITESSKSLLTKKMKKPREIASWLNETFDQLGLDTFYLCGMSIGGWNSVNYATYFGERIRKLILISPIQTLSKMYTGFFFKIMKMGFHPTRENVEAYIGWGGEKEAPLPDSVIEQFTISVMNVNGNAAFPKMLKKKQLKKLKMPILVLLGQNEFAFDIKKAKENAVENISYLELRMIEGASHLIAVSRPEITNEHIKRFLTE